LPPSVGTRSMALDAWVVDRKAAILRRLPDPGSGSAVESAVRRFLHWRHALDE
jgi:hypothetical protein